MDSGQDGPPTSPPTAYPAAFETDVVLADGATAHVRPIRPDDGPRILAFHARQSPQSIYYRYFSPRPRLSERDVDRLTNVDYVDRMALVALRGDELIGVARYDRWRHRSEAEVAFFVDDANHGRGLATVMLEHLAVRARDVGLTGFTASVLPENRRMIGVFNQAGFESATRFADGVIEVRLGLSPTPEAEAAIEARAATAAAQAVRRLLSPRSVAVIGASRNPGIGHDLLHNLQRAGFEGPIWPVNPAAVHVGGIRAVPSILDIADDVDLAVIAVPAAAVARAVEECGRKQVYGVIILSAGFAEEGADGAALEAEVLRVARSWGIRIVGPNCLGIINTDPAVRLHATFANVVPLPGRVSLLSESGMVGAAIIGRARDAGVGISSFVALGNRVDVSGNDLLQYWTGDEHTDVVCMYIESFGNARRFSRLVRRLARTKPVVAVKSGRLPRPRGSTGLPDPTEEALLRQTGVLRVPTLPALLDTARMLICQPLPRGRRVAVVGNAGGSLAIAADAALVAGLELAALAPGTRQLLGGIVGRSVEDGNPIDLGLRAGSTEFTEAVEALVTDPGVDLVLAMYAPSLGGGPADVRAALDAGRKAAPDVPLAACFYGPVGDDGAAPAAGAVPVYDAVDAAARALGRVADYAEWLSLPEGLPLELDDAIAAAARSVVSDVLERGERGLEPETAGRLLDCSGLARVASLRAGSVGEAVTAAEQIGYPVVLKAARRDRMAKTAAAGFALDLSDEAALRAAWARMEEHIGDGMVPALVQRMVDPGVDVAVTVAENEQVGPVISLRPGGAAAALDVNEDIRVLPLGDLEVRRLIEGSRLAAVLQPPARQVLERLLLTVGALVEAVPEIVALHLNPVIIGEDEAVVTDALIEVAELDREPVPLIRRV